jgi:hypothetical protein
MAELLRADVADQMRGRVRMAVDVAIETGHVLAGLERTLVHACVGMRSTKKHHFMPTQAWSMAPVKENLYDRRAMPRKENALPILRTSMGRARMFETD